VTKFKHPVDILKDLGVQMTPDAEAKARALCDEMVADLERRVIEGEGEGKPVGIFAGGGCVAPGEPYLVGPHGIEESWGSWGFYCKNCGKRAGQCQCPAERSK
jgi:hypothetical protein